MLLPPSENKDFYYIKAKLNRSDIIKNMLENIIHTNSSLNIKVWTNLRRSTFDYKLSNYDNFLMEKKHFNINRMFLSLTVCLFVFKDLAYRWTIVVFLLQVLGRFITVFGESSTTLKRATAPPPPPTKKKNHPKMFLQTNA